MEAWGINCSVHCSSSNVSSGGQTYVFQSPGHRISISHPSATVPSPRAWDQEIEDELRWGPGVLCPGNVERRENSTIINSAADSKEGGVGSTREDKKEHTQVCRGHSWDSTSEAWWGNRRRWLTGGRRPGSVLSSSEVRGLLPAGCTTVTEGRSWGVQLQAGGWGGSQPLQGPHHVESGQQASSPEHGQSPQGGGLIPRGAKGVSPGSAHII